MQDVFHQTKLAIALRVARAAMGWSQDELAQAVGMAKTTLARAETAEGNLSTVQLSQILSIYAANGIDVQFMLDNDLTLKISESGMLLAQARLLDASNRRSDRAKPIGLIASPAAQPLQSPAGVGLLGHDPEPTGLLGTISGKGKSGS